MLVSLLVAVTACNSEPGFEGRSAAEWIATLQSDTDSIARRDAAVALGAVLRIAPDAPRVVDALVVALADSIDDVRIAAATSLIRGGTLPAVAVPGVLDALADSAHAHTRAHAAFLLGMVSPDAAAVTVDRLTRAVADRDADVRSAAINSLGRYMRLPPAALAALRQAVSDSNDFVRETAIEALTQSASITGQRVDLPLFVAALADSSGGVRSAAGFALAAFGSAAAPAVPDLIRALADSSAEVRRAAARALGQIGAPARMAASALEGARLDANAGVQAEAREALARLGGATAP